MAIPPSLPSPDLEVEPKNLPSPSGDVDRTPDAESTPDTGGTTDRTPADPGQQPQPPAGSSDDNKLPDVHKL